MTAGKSRRSRTTRSGTKLSGLSRRDVTPANEELAPAAFRRRRLPQARGCRRRLSSGVARVSPRTPTIRSGYEPDIST
jgi:hypothetical protein